MSIFKKMYQLMVLNDLIILITSNNQILERKKKFYIKKNSQLQIWLIK